MNRGKIIAAFVSLGLIWGGAFVAIKIVVSAIPPVHAAMIRLWIAVPFLWITFKLFRQKIQIPQRFWIASWVAGLFMIGIPYAFVFWGETKISAGLAGIVNGTVPLWTTCLTALPFSPLHNTREKVDRRLLTGIGLGFVGMLIIFGPRVQLADAEAWGVAAVLAMALCYSLSNVLNARLFAKAENLSITGNVFHQHVISLIFLSSLAPLIEVGPSNWSPLLSPRVLGSLIFLGVLSGSTALLLYYYLIKEIGAIRTSSITYLIPVASVILDVLILGSLPGPSTLLGATFILLAILFIRSGHSPNSIPKRQ